MTYNGECPTRKVGLFPILFSVWSRGSGDRASICRVPVSVEMGPESGSMTASVVRCNFDQTPFLGLRRFYGSSASLVDEVSLFFWARDWGVGDGTDTRGGSDALCCGGQKLVVEEDRGTPGRLVGVLLSPYGAGLLRWQRELLTSAICSPLFGCSGVPLGWCLLVGLLGLHNFRGDAR
ncbi:uncharacterized protein LOC133746368 [Rosa rugosa]|uniref:uncharacterized protein LOC133746368 n=1 Tax=Rosa rugosa TaxID=74645 RepID=UPI002B411402|nr:uncharacterized protein LOC133746368 [Rosa rugosa]